MGVKETRPEKAEVSQRGYEQGICVSQNLCTWLSEPEVPWPVLIRYGSNEVERFLRLDNRHPWGHSQGAWLYFSTYAKPPLLHLYPGGIRAKCYPHLLGSEEPVKEQEEGTRGVRGLSIRHFLVWFYQWFLFLWVLPVWYSTDISVPTVDTHWHLCLTMARSVRGTEEIFYSFLKFHLVSLYLYDTINSVASIVIRSQQVINSFKNNFLSF